MVSIIIFNVIIQKDVSMALHERAGKPAQQSDLINVAKLISDYYTLIPDDS